MKNRFSAQASGKALEIFAALTLMLFMISGAVVLSLNFRPLYYADIKSLEIAELSGLPEEEIRANYDALIDYNSIFGSGELKLPTLPMSNEGRIHFEEVKQIFVAIEILFAFSLVGTAAFILFFRQNKNYRFLRLGAMLSVALPAFAGILIAVNWNQAFILFHKIFFNNDYWIFSPDTDPVITILPDTFFMHCAVMIISVVVLCAAAAFFTGHKLDKRMRKD